MTAAPRRREVILGGGALLSSLALEGCVAPRALRAGASLPPVRASADRIIRITVCTRPFRADGPRIEAERIGDQMVVHNYGHGGSGWSLSWGSSRLAVDLALATGVADIAVIGCGALGLTSATLLQRAGAAVTIYAKDRPPEVRSSLATGLWTPDSRICLEDRATPAFRRTWEAMCRTSFASYQGYLGLPGDPVEWIDMYNLARPAADRAAPAPPSPIRFAEMQDELVPDLIPRALPLADDANPFPGRVTRRRPAMMFNLTAYQHLLMAEYLENGGRIETREFHEPSELAGLRQRTIINATGYGARRLFRDASIIPVRGQLARLIPQPEVAYGLYFAGVLMVPRRDGLVVQALGPDEGAGYGDESTAPDRADAERAVATIARAFQPAAGA